MVIPFIGSFKMRKQEFELMDSLTSHWVVEFDIKFLIHIFVIYVPCYVRDAVVLVKSNFTGFAIHHPSCGVLSDSTFAIFDLFDNIEILLITHPMHF